MSDCCDAQLAETALNMAVSRRRRHPQDCCITVIAGVNTLVEQARKRLEQMAAVGSQSRKGNWWDNAAMESFFGSLTRRMCGKHDLSIS